jgi:glycosyltransferase involved in cell wall biosynthesis
MSEDTQPRVSIVIPVYNGGSAFRACLESLKALDPRPLEIIVVGDADTDGSSEAARKAGALVWQTPSRRGPAAARNLGAEKASGDVLFFMDADVIVSPNVVSRVAEAFYREPCLAALFGSYDDAPAEPGFLSQYRNLLHHHVHQTARENAATFWAACGAVRRDVFLSLNGFNAGYKRPSIEDIELGCRLKKQGHRIRLDKRLLVKHLKRWNALSVLRTDFLDRALPWSRLILQEGPFINDLNLRIENRLSVACVFMLTVSLIMTPMSAHFWVPVLFLLLMLVMLNRNLYRFFIEKRGSLFTLGAIPWHWLHYLSSALAFAIGLGELGLRRFRILSQP